MLGRWTGRADQARLEERPLTLRHRAGVGARSVVATDGLQHSEPAVEWGARLAEVREWPLVLVRTVFDGLPSSPVPPDTGEHDRAWTQLRTVERHVRRSHPSLDVSLRMERGLSDEAIIRAATGMDVVVLGPHTRRSIAGILDLDVTRSLVERAPCLVSVVPARD